MITRPIMETCFLPFLQFTHRMFPILWCLNSSTSSRKFTSHLTPLLLLNQRPSCPSSIAIYVSHSVAPIQLSFIFNFPAFHLRILMPDENHDAAPQALRLWSDALHMAPRKKKYAESVNFCPFVLSS